MDRPLPAVPPPPGSQPPTVYSPQGTPPQVAPPVELPSLDFLGLSSVLARRKWLILGITILTTALAILYLRHSPRVYQSTGLLKVEAEDAKLGPFDPVKSEDLTSIDALKTVELSLTSTSLLDRMITNHQLDKHLNGSQGAMIHQLSANSSISLVRGTRSVSISYRSTNPQFAKKVVDAYIAEFDAVQAEEKKALELTGIERLTEQETTLKQKLQAADQAVENFAKKHFNLELGSSRNAVNDTLSDLLNRLADARAQRVTLEKALGVKRPMKTDEILKISAISQQADIQALLTDLRREQSAFDVLKEEKLSKHPEYQEAEKRIASARSQLDTAAQAALDAKWQEYASARDAEAAFEQDLQAQQGKVGERSQLVTEYKRLETEAASLRGVLDEVTARLRQTQVSLDLHAPVISVTQAPMVSEFPIWPNQPFILGGGLMAGLIGGVGLAFALEVLRRKIRDGGDVTKIFPQLPCLANLPSVRIRKPSESLVIANDPHSAAAEGFRALRTSLYFQSRGEPKIVLFTSANAGEGKSYTAMNCAAAYAMQGYQTLLIDGDLRCPSLEPIFLKGRNRGLSDFLRGRMEAHEVCYPTKVKGLYFIPSGDLRPNPSELLSSPALAELLAKGSQFFDKIVIDCAPLVPVSDGLMLARHSDATCLVVRANRSLKQELIQVRDILNKTGRPLAGYVLNDCEGGDAGSSYITYMSNQKRRNKLDSQQQQALPAAPTPLSDKAAVL